MHPKLPANLDMVTMTDMPGLLGMTLQGFAKHLKPEVGQRDAVKAGQVIKPWSSAVTAKRIL
ncbi:MAG: hypothetical protein ACN6OP_07395 [Pseudomonadales bacterium]